LDESSAIMTDAYSGVDLTALSVGNLVWMASAQPILDERSEDQLIESARTGDRRSIEELAMRNLRVVIDEAIRTRGLGMSQEGLVRVGVRALLDAARYYDPVVHGRFSIHLRGQVREAIQRTIGLS